MVTRCSQRPGAVSDGHQALLMPRRVSDQFITHADNQRQQRDTGQQLRGKSIEGKQRINQDRDHHHDHQEAGPAARMEGDELLRVLHGHRLAGFEIENHFVLGAVILEHAADVFHARNNEQESKENHQPQNSRPSSSLRAGRAGLEKSGRFRWPEAAAQTCT